MPFIKDKSISYDIFLSYARKDNLVAKGEGCRDDRGAAAIVGNNTGWRRKSFLKYVDDAKYFDSLTPWNNSAELPCFEHYISYKYGAYDYGQYELIYWVLVQYP